jgi:dihydroflavonol-4-reductase
MKNVLVTGANGHVGNNMVQLLVQNGYKVRASVRDLKGEAVKTLQSLKVELVEADIMKPETLPNALKGMDGVFQIAAVYTMWSKNPQRDIIDPSVIGGINVLQAAKDAGVKRVVFTSSCAAIGVDATPDRPLTESDWNETAQSPYMMAKTQAEKRAWEFAKKNDLDLVTICPSGIIGPGFYRHTPTTQIFELVLRGKLPAVPPFAFSYVDVRDVARAHLLAYENPRASGRYIASDICVPLMDLMKLLNQIDSSIKVPAMTVPSPLLGAMPLFDWLGNKVMGMPRQITKDMVVEFAGKYQHVSNEKIKRELGWKPMDLKQSLRDTIEWIRKIFINKN